MTNLTGHKEGSVRELWSISFPLMISSFSVLLLVFVDRILLARFSADALNASVTASTLGWAFVFGWMVLSGISQVFVAQYNGAGRWEKLGEPVWQMIWLSIGSTAFFFPLSVWGSEYIFGSQHPMERDYFQWMVLFGPSFAIYGALTGFYIGQGKTFLITILALATNIVNAFLDVVLIFGWEGVMAPLGVKGAAIATCSSSVFQIVVLGGIFLSRKNRRLHRTGKFTFKHQVFLECFKVGLPGALFAAAEIGGWAAYYWMMTWAGDGYITTVGICQSVIILFYFFGEGIGKAATAIAGNYIGGGRLFVIPKVLYSGFILHGLFFLFICLLFWGYTDYVIGTFLPSAEPEMVALLYDTLVRCLFGILFYVFFEGLRLLLSGVLTAAGDTFFLLVMGSSSIWFLLVLPVYFIVVKGGASVEVSTMICIFYSAMSCVLYFWRFSEGKWKSISILS